MEREWISRPLEGCMAAIIDYRGKTPRKTSHGIPLITAKVVKGGRILAPDEFIAPEEYDSWMRRGMPMPGDVLVTTEAPLGEVAQLGSERVALAQRLIALRGHSDILDNGFLKFLMQSDAVQSQLHGRATGTTVVGIKQSELRKLTLTLPPVDEQHAIAHILGALDDKIELNRCSNETLEAMARALFKDWFVDFGPVRAKRDGREPYLAPELWSHFPDAMDDDETPRGWAHSTLADVALLNSESWSAKDAPSDVEYIDLANTKWGVIESTSHLAWSDAPSRARRILRTGDTIVGTVRPGNGSYCYIGRDGLTGSTGFAVLRPKADNYREFVYLAATATDNIERLAHLADGGAYPAVRPEAVAASHICRPDESVIAGFSNVISPMAKRVEQAKVESQALTALRDTLLPKLLSGELRVRDAERLFS